MPDFGVCVVGEINLDLILYGLPKVLELDRELLASGLAITLGSSSAILLTTLQCSGARLVSSGKSAVMRWGKWRWNVWRLPVST